nr:putative reverse transcriptase domain-containing protein [Tanacetum cinerariifolium]
MMQLVPVEKVYMEALQVKHPIIDWEIHTEGKRTYWKIIRLGGNTYVYQFFVDMLKHFDREDLNQMWTLVKETLSIRQATSDKEKELWVKLKRLYVPDVEDQLWTQTQALMHDLVEWRLYDTCGVHHVLSRDQEIFMLELPQELSRVHHTFHVSNLKKCYADEPFVMSLKGIHVDDKLKFVEEPVKIMEREIKRLKRSRIPLVKVRWNSRIGHEFTWEREDSFKQKYLQLFTNRASSSTT